MNIIIVGGGQVGSYIANLLLKESHQVRIIDNRESIIEKLRMELPHECIVWGNGTDPDILEKAGIIQADTLVAVTGADETNLVATTLAKFEFNVPKTIGRVNNPKNAWLFNKSNGVDISMNQADIMGHLVVEEMDLANMFTLLKLSLGNYSILQIKVEENSAAIGKFVRDLQIPDEARLILLSRGDVVTLLKGDTSIRYKDIILGIANETSKPVLNRIFQAPKTR